MKVVAAIALAFVAGSCGNADRDVTADRGDGAPLAPVTDRQEHEAPESRDPGMQWRPARLGEGSWSGARSSPDGRTLLIALVGGPEYRDGDSCTVAYDAEVDETPSEVRLMMLSASPPAEDDFACTTEGHFRTVEVRLAAPLGDRRLVEVQFEREQPVFDGGRLLQPTWLPDGFSLRTEGPGDPDPEEVRSWQRTWSGPARPPDDDRCTPGESPISLAQGSASLVEEYPSNGEQPRRTHDVRGATATYYDGGTMGINRLAWAQGDEGFVLASTPSCAGDTPTSEEALLRIARGLEVPGTG